PTAAPHSPPLEIETLYVDEGNQIWAGTTYDGLIRCTPPSWVIYSEEQGLIHHTVLSVFRRRNGVLLCGTRLGLGAMAKERFQNSSAPEFKETAIAALLEDADRNLWVGTTRGLVRQTDRGRRTYGPVQGLPSPVVRCLLMDDEKGLWIGTDRGLARLAGDTVHTFTGADGLSGHQVHRLLADREGNLWVGTSGGLDRFRKSSITTLPLADGEYAPVYTLLADPAGGVWCGGPAGLQRLDRQGYHIAGFDNGIDAPFVRSLGFGPDGNLLAGTDAHGVFRRQGDEFMRWRPFYLHDDPSVLAIYMDDRGRTWFGSRDGLSCLVDDRLHTWLPSDRPAEKTIRTISQDRQGRLWVGTDNGVGYRVGEDFRFYRTTDGLPHGSVYDIHPDRDGSLWIATHGGGLARWREEGFAVVDTRRGLASNYLYQILEDDFGRFWMSSDQGLFSVAAEQLRRCADGVMPTVECLRVGLADGLKTLRGSGGNCPGAIKTADGNLWFPSAAGVIRVDPRPDNTGKDAPPVLIEEVRLSGQAVSIQEELECPADAVLTIRYTAIALATPERIRFRYRLQGLSEQWLDAGSDRNLRLVGLAPGRYRFEVSAARGEGPWQSRTAILALVVQAPFWRQGWFTLLGFVGLAALLYVGYRGVRRWRTILHDWRRAHTIGHYELLATLGQGGMGTVHKARDRKTRRLVAIKLLHPELVTAETHRRFEQEGKVLRRLDHPNVVRLLDQGRHQGRLYWVMEFCAGQDLRQRLTEHGPLPPDQALALFAPLADTVHDMHKAGIIHRDLKPENIMILPPANHSPPSSFAFHAPDNGPPSIRILDFGIATLIGQPALTRTGRLAGTLPYLPPEQLGGLAPHPAMDFYALGIILYEMLTGTTPFHGEDNDPARLMYALLHEDPVPPREVDPAIPAAVSDFCLALIRRSRRERLADHAAIRDELRRIGSAR
ncbi:MAG: protein kinase, partial [Acidobacteria bacterium]|nr:protein kinase [Acidobacteriota bacterium]